MSAAVQAINNSPAAHNQCTPRKLDKNETEQQQIHATETRQVDEGAYRMLCCSFRAMRSSSSRVSAVYQQQPSTTIDADLERERDERKKHLKILILGGPESGKSTVFKQMRILHKSGFSKYDIINYRYIIYENIVTATRQLIEGARHLQLPLDKDTEMAAARFVMLTSEGSNETELSDALVFSIRVIYASDAVRQALARRASIALLDSAEYFLDNLERIADPAFMPSNEDILRSRNMTAGIIEIEFAFRGTIMRMIDVGGQRSQRRKWLHCFDDVNSVLFIVDVSSYNQRIDANEQIEAASLPPNNATSSSWNRLKHSMAIFRSIARHPAFKQRIALILFLNKIDLFRAKIDAVPLAKHFRRYDGPPVGDASAAYIAERFRQLVERKRRTRGGGGEGATGQSGGGRSTAKMQIEEEDTTQLYMHMTTATDTEAVNMVFSSCVDVILQRKMQAMGTQ